MPRRRTYRRRKNALIASLDSLGTPPPPRTYTFHEHSPSSPSSSSSERSESAPMQIGVTALGRTGTAAQNNINPPVTTWREWAFGTVGKGKRRKRRSAAYKSRKRNRRRH